MLSENSTVMEKVKDLCATITADPEYQEALGRVERFLENEQAKTLYQNVHEQGEALHQKQHSGVELSETEIAGFEQAREELFKNEVASDFHAAQQELEMVQSAVNRFVGKAIELGKVPEASDFSSSGEGGCCGGGCGCG